MVAWRILCILFSPSLGRCHARIPKRQQTEGKEGGLLYSSPQNRRLLLERDRAAGRLLTRQLEEVVLPERRHDADLRDPRRASTPGCLRPGAFAFNDSSMTLPGCLRAAWYKERSGDHLWRAQRSDDDALVLTEALATHS